VTSTVDRKLSYRIGNKSSHCWESQSAVHQDWTILVNWCDVTARIQARSYTFNKVQAGSKWHHSFKSGYENHKRTRRSAFVAALLRKFSTIHAGRLSDLRSGHSTPTKELPVTTQYKAGWVPGTISTLLRTCFVTFLGIEPWFLGCPACSIVTILTELSRLPRQVTGSQKRGFSTFVASLLPCDVMFWQWQVSEKPRSHDWRKRTGPVV
jgi:hypothetical protein